MAPSQPYFVNRYVDIFCISGISILSFVGFWAAGWNDRSEAVISAGFYLMWIVNWPHFSMTLHRLYQSKEHVKQYPVTSIGIPLLLVAGTVAALSSPDLLAGYFVKVFLIWSPYHFSGQTMGITLIYAKRSGYTLKSFERLVLAGFVFGTFVFSTLKAEVTTAGYPYYGVDTPTLGVPYWFVEYANWGMTGCGVLFASFLVWWSFKNRKFPPLLVVLTPFTQFLWFVVASEHAGFREFVPLFHSLQYILIAWGVQMKEKLDLKSIEPSPKYVRKETAIWFTINVAGGIGLFWLIPRIGAAFGHPILFAEGVTIAAVQIHHFFVDGVIWKLKKRTNQHPLMMNIKEVNSAAKTGRPLVET